MVEVNLWSGLRRHTDGVLSVEVEASTIGEMLDALVARYPGLKEVIDEGVSVAVDGEVIPAGLNEPIRPENEIYLMRPLKGG